MQSTLSLDAGGLTYTASGDSLDDTLNITAVAAAQSLTASASVPITVWGPTRTRLRPVAPDYEFTVTEGYSFGASLLTNAHEENGSETISLTEINGEPIEFGTQTELDSGADLTVEEDGAFVYVPADDFTGQDGFSYTVSDGYSTATGWVTMNVVADDTLQAVDDAYTTQENQELNAGSGQTQPSILTNDLAASPPTISFINGTPINDDSEADGYHFGEAISLEGGS